MTVAAKFVITALACLLMSGSLCQAQALSPLIRVTLAKVQKREGKAALKGSSASGWWGSNASMRSVPSSAYYEIKIQYLGMAPMKNVRMAWTTLSEKDVKRDIVSQGEKTIDLEMGKALELQTDSLDGKATGCLVELFNDKALVATAGEPTDVKTRITKATRAAAKPQ